MNLGHPKQQIDITSGRIRKNRSKFAQIRCTVSNVPYSLAKADGSAAPVRLRSHEICDEVLGGERVDLL